ncbi:MAG: terpene synthase family protein [Myxococcota bacterium]
MSAAAAGDASSFRALLPKPWRHAPSADALANWIARSLADNQIFDSQEARQKRVPQITVFVAHCAPVVAPPGTLELAAQFLFAFFLLNDHWESTRALIRGESAQASHGVAFVRDWLATLRQTYGARAQRFILGFERYLQSLEREKLYEANAGHPTFAEYVDREFGRYQWVATPPYIELWEMSLGIELGEPARRAADDMKALGVELTYIANDIGSLARDQAQKNFVTLLMQEEPLLTTLDAALARASAIYREKADRLRSARQAQSADTSLGRYAELVCNITDGNLRATTLLAHTGAAARYSPAARECLEGLPFTS